MGISRDSRHKRRATGGRRKIHQKKRKYEMGRPAAMTRIGPKRVVEIRVRGGNKKYRSLRLETGNFSWGSECCTRKCRVMDVAYNASNNELVRTQTLVKNSIIQVDATPFRQWYEQHYGVVLVKGKEEEERKMSKSVEKKLAKRVKENPLEARLKEQLVSGRIYACIASRPGQSGRCDGYILEGKELEFYTKKLQKKKGKK